MHRALLLLLALSAGTESQCSPPATADAEPAIASALPAAGTAAPRVTFDHEHPLWSEVLGAHVQGDRFDYRALKEDRSRLDSYLQQLESITPEVFAAWTREQRYAFWINAYNAYTVSRVVEHYPVESIKDIGSMLKSVWDQRFIPLHGLDPDLAPGDLSLNEIEHSILRPKFEDARVHAAVNCASEGCPPLLDRAFVPEKLERQLDAQIRAWLADPQRNRFDREAGTIQLSEIFKWFGEDFQRDGGDVVAWIARYAPEEQRAWLAGPEKPEVSYLDYSWALNDVRR